jgi:hypothetical protein
MPDVTHITSIAERPDSIPGGGYLDDTALAWLLAPGRDQGGALHSAGGSQSRPSNPRHGNLSPRTA